MLQGGVGQTIQIPFVFRSDPGDEIAASDVTVSISDPLGNTVATGLTPTLTDGQGAYDLSYAIPAAGTLGLWSSQWSGTSEGTPVGGHAWFVVVGSPAATLVTPDQVATYTNKPLDAASYSFLSQVLSMLQGELQMYLGRPLAPTWLYDTHRMMIDDTRIFLNNTPVHAVNAVYVDADTGNPEVLSPLSYVVRKWGIEIADFLYQVYFSGNAIASAGVADSVDMLIEYQAGIPGSDIPGLQGLMTRAAAREWLAFLSDVQNVALLRAGEMLQYTFSDKNIGGFTPAELKSIRRYKRRRVA